VKEAVLSLMVIGPAPVVSFARTIEANQKSQQIFGAINGGARPWTIP
jgi:hypothetical protein